MQYVPLSSRPILKKRKGHKEVQPHARIQAQEALTL